MSLLKLLSELQPLYLTALSYITTLYTDIQSHTACFIICGKSTWDSDPLAN